MSRADANNKFIPVDLKSLSEGQLAERELYIHLPANGRFVRLVRPLIPIEAWALEKFRRIGTAFAVGQNAVEKYEQLDASAQAVAEICSNEELAPYEKNREIRARTEWLVPLILGQARAPEAAVFFLQRAFGLPRPETLLYVLDASVAGYERSVLVSAVSGVLALWLGYSDAAFLRQFVEAAFCQDVRNAPGTEAPDYRFTGLVGAGQDELSEVVRLAGALCGLVGAEAIVDRPRVARKLGRQFKLDSIAVASGVLIGAHAGKAAA